MDLLLMKLKDAYNEDIILIYLRSKKESQKLINISEIRDDLFGSSFSFELVRKYAEELKKEKVVIIDKHNPSNIGHSYDADLFIQEGGFVKKLFIDEKIIYSTSLLTEAHYKDIILFRAKQIDNFLNESDIKSIFLIINDRKIRYYIDQIRNDGYIKASAPDEYFFRYDPSADMFLEEGGYAGKYLNERLKVAELKMLNDPQILTLEEIKSKRTLEKRKQYIDNWKTGINYFVLKYGIIALAVIIPIVIALIILGLITPERAFSGFKWLFKHIFS